MSQNDLVTQREVVVTSGVGPREVQWFTEQLAEWFVATIEAAGGRVLSVSGCIASGDRSIRVAWRGALPPDCVGTHVLVHAHRGRRARKRWYAWIVAVEPLVVPSAVDLEALAAEVRTEVCRAGGPGGQHVNTSATAVRLVHEPSGLAVRCQSERSQRQNRRAALRRLASLLEDRQADQQRNQRSRRRAAHYGRERGRPVREFRLIDGRLEPVTSPSVPAAR